MASYAYVYPYHIDGISGIGIVLWFKPFNTACAVHTINNVG